MDRYARVKNEQDSSVNVYLNGLGLGSIAAAMYLIQKADFNPSSIHIFEQMGDKQLVGGSCDASEVMVGDEFAPLFPKSWPELAAPARTVTGNPRLADSGMKSPPFVAGTPVPDPTGVAMPVVVSSV